MKRLMPSSLITFLQANPTCVRADLFTINLVNGHTINATSGQFDITVPSGTNGFTGSTTTFYANQYGVWSRGAITSEAGYDLNSNTMELTCIPQSTTPFPGLPITLLNAAWNSLFDAATVTVQTAYFTTANGYGNVSAGIETKFSGQITKVNDLTRLKLTFDCADYLYLLNMKVPTRVIKSTCPWSFADSNCQLNPTTFTTTFTAATGTTQWLVVPSTAFSHASGYYTQGVVKCLTGANAGLSQSVRVHDSTGHLQLSFPWLITPNIGDTFSVIAGCDKSVGTCTQKFNNLINFGGMPFCPVPQSTI